MNIQIRSRYKEGILPEDYSNQVAEDNESITVENDSLSVQDIFERSVINQGYQIDNMETQDNIDGLDLEEFKRLDLVEQHQIIHEQKEYVKELNRVHKEATKKVEEEPVKEAEIVQNKDEEKD